MTTVTAPTFAEQFTEFLVKWTPRMIAVAIGGYYGLGIAYEYGIMAEVDKIAIPIIKHFFGYAGIGAMMPTVQWYSSWAVRIAVGLAAGLVYDLAERCALYFYSFIKAPDETSSNKLQLQ